MTVKDKQPSAALARLQAERDSAYDALQEIKRTRDAFASETQSMRADLTARRDSHPQEFIGAQRAVKPGTTAAKNSAVIKQRMGEPNPHKPEFNEARSHFHEQDAALQTFRRDHLGSLLAEIDEAQAEPARQRVVDSLQLLVSAASEYEAARVSAQEAIGNTRSLNGQHVGWDQRVGEWGALASEALTSDIGKPYLTEEGRWRLENVG